MTMQRNELAVSSDVAAIEALVPISGLSLIDVGCGPGPIARELVARGARVLGVEPDPIQAEKNRAAPAVSGLAFAEAGAEALPAESDSADGVIFGRSLHHVPLDKMDTALAEAARVLRPGGYLCVLEPAMEGSQFALMKPFHDETIVRTAALAALARTTPPLFGRAEHYRYAVDSRFSSFSEFVERMVSATFNNHAREHVDTEEVRTLFEAGPTPEGDYAFDQPMLLSLYRDPQVS
ncbi:MAG: class I SAM-dependent methyltransferase [Novosphingobium sp.]